MERRHFLEREEVAQLIALGMALASRDILARLDPRDFHLSLASVVKRMQEAAANGGAVPEVDNWLECNVGTRRPAGQKVVDFVLDRVRSDGLIRHAGNEGRNHPTIDGLLLRMKRLGEERNKKN